MGKVNVVNIVNVIGAMVEGSADRLERLQEKRRGQPVAPRIDVDVS
jgi:hypothetical protein